MAGIAALALPVAGQADAAVISAEQLAGQRIVYAFQGTTPPAGLEARIRRGEASSVILFGGNIRSVGQARRLVRRLQSIRRPRGMRQPLLVMVDQEGGSVRRVPGGPQRSAATLGRLGSTAKARAAGRAAAKSVRSIAANVNLAPVADVARPGSAMQREGRSFGRDQAKVTKLVAAYVAGLRQRGVAGTAKHYPGFGAAAVNTDNAPATIRLSRTELRSVDQRPYDLLIRRRVPLIMLSTAIYPALDSRPAALSGRIATVELRRRQGFAGVSISDALDTPALARYRGSGRTGVAAARAGTDLLIFATNYAAGDRAADAIARAIRAKRISRRSALRSYARITELRRSVR